MFVSSDFATMVIVQFNVLLVIIGGIVSADNLALLSGTLRQYQRAGCDNDMVVLKCPAGTSIAIELARYGNASPTSLCGQRDLKTFKNDNGSCLWPKALQYSLLQTVVEACQKKRQCKFQTSPETFGGDPCPGVRKYVEVVYKCRPYEFRSKVACQNERVQLKCNPHSRVAVYSASYGRTEYESFQCPQPQGVAEETCLVSYATETVMHICHGKRSCELSADASTFGNPCRPDSRMYLKVVYTCVPRKVLREKYEGRIEPDELEGEGDTDDAEFDNYDDGNEFIREPAASPPAPSIVGSSKGDNLTNDFAATSSKLPPQNKPKGLDPASFESRTTPRSRLKNTNRLFDPHSDSLPRKLSTKTKTIKDVHADIGDTNCTVAVFPAEANRVIGFISEWINTYTFLSRNMERMYLYLILSVGSAVVLCLIAVVVRLLLQRHRTRREAKFQTTDITDNSLPNGFTDDISEVDADIDLTPSMPPSHVLSPHSPVPLGSIAEVVRYPQVHSHTLRKQSHDMEAPRSLSSSSNHYYYG